MPTQDGRQRRKAKAVYAWKKLRAVIEAKVAGDSRYHQRNRTLGISATLSAEVDEQLVGWINELRADGVPVPRPADHATVRSKPLGAGESIFCSAISSLFAADPRRPVYTGRRRAEGGGVQQQRVNYEYVPTSTITTRGAKTMWVKCAGKSKARVTAMPLSACDGSKREPFLIFKTRPSTKPDVARENKVMRHGFGADFGARLTRFNKVSISTAMPLGGGTASCLLSFCLYTSVSDRTCTYLFLCSGTTFGALPERGASWIHLRAPTGRRTMEQATQGFYKEAVGRVYISSSSSGIRWRHYFQDVTTNTTKCGSLDHMRVASLTHTTITGGFKKAKLAITTMLMPPQPTPLAPPASDLGPLVMLLLLSNVALQAVDPAKGIDYNELDGEEDGAEGDCLAQSDAS
ncbi:uncharacterized protein PITG_04472 [Phytophthora infestans T30-4]|uniref:HTH CENPB-type domain-containing protein n=1 Tax=Phytophthora infestans (strain T30-4) TaxID=403677 RepID=D0N1C1_PHYIT|nr:uncharacterized protein PITG_04472 [Phytophthora infestans T30-4]EEY67434.1 conserved hypothetical protein [Phytophthora infestans T30-4]|eukprot:XP_002906082.1 conserved hypothetical protein [Phytophthora infestans T30-4]